MTSESFERDFSEIVSDRGIRADRIAEDLCAAFQRAHDEQAAECLRPSALGVDVRRALRCAIRAFALRSRLNRATPEATLVTLKQLLRTVAPDMTDIRPMSADDAEQDLFAKVVAWCIEDYYRDD